MPQVPDVSLAPLLTPSGHLRLVVDSNAQQLPAAMGNRLNAAFTRGHGHGLLYLGACAVASALPPALAWWRDYAARYVTVLCATSDGSQIAIARPDAVTIDAIIDDVPPMTGADYLTPSVLLKLWDDLDVALRVELSESKLPLQDFLRALYPAWNLVGKVHFNLAENRKDPDAPFAFLATYSSRLSAHGKAQHLPLSKALTEFSDGKSKAQLLSLLQPVQRAAQSCSWLREMVDSGEIYHPLRWTPADAWRLLSDVPALEAAGIIVRAPGNWSRGRPQRPLVRASVGAKPPPTLGMDALLDFNVEVTLEGEQLGADDIKALLKGVDGLQLIRGKWVEVDKERLGRLLERFRLVEQAAAGSGVPFAEAMRLMAGSALDGGNGEREDADWLQFAAGPWLAETLQGLRQPTRLARVDPGSELKTILRPYQQAGVR
jgi:non-specific serine/threonine protein kinase